MKITACCFKENSCVKTLKLPSLSLSRITIKNLKCEISAAGAITPLGPAALHTAAQHSPRDRPPSPGPAAHREQRERGHRGGPGRAGQAQEQLLHDGQQHDAGRGVRHRLPPLRGHRGGEEPPAGGSDERRRWR